MKLFVWLCPVDQWNHGLLVAQAHNVAEAVALLKRRGVPEHYFTDDGGFLTEDGVIYPITHAGPAAAYVLGGLGG